LIICRWRSIEKDEIVNKESNGHGDQIKF
jgi:hypothetical protein